MPTALPPPPDGSFASDNAAGVSPEVWSARALPTRARRIAYGDDRVDRGGRGGLPRAVRRTGRGASCAGAARAPTSSASPRCCSRGRRCSPPTAPTSSSTSAAPRPGSPGSMVIPLPHDRREARVPSSSSPTSSGTGASTTPSRPWCRSAVDRDGRRLHRRRARGALRLRPRPRPAASTSTAPGSPTPLVATGSDVPTMVRDTGVDVLTFGLTKDGAMYGEAVVFLDPSSPSGPRSSASRPASSRRRPGSSPRRSRPCCATTSGCATPGEPTTMAGVAGRSGRTDPGCRT